MLILVNIDIFGHKMKFEEDKIIIRMNNVYINDIVNVELLDDVYIGSKIGGTNTFKYLRGNFKLEENTKGKVYVYNDSKAYIRITTKDKIIIYNDENSNETYETYNKLLDVCDINKSIDTKEYKPSESNYTSRNNIVLYIAMMPAVIVFVCIGIYALKKKTPMHFWSGTTVKPEEISDIKAYNKANGIMWILFGLSFLVLTLLESIIGSGIYSIIPILEVIIMVICYNIIYNKYKVK